MPLRNFSFITSQLAGMAYPTASSFQELESLGISTIINLTPVPLDVVGNFRFRVYHFPIVDGSAPSVTGLQDIVTTIESELTQSDSKVVVHCAAGLGRTGVVLTAFVLRNWHLRGKAVDVEEALKTIRSYRPGSVETPEQEELLHKYASWLQGFGKG